VDDSCQRVPRSKSIPHDSTQGLAPAPHPLCDTLRGAATRHEIHAQSEVA
jgi:hypothetical protein